MTLCLCVPLKKQQTQNRNAYGKREEEVLDLGHRAEGHHRRGIGHSRRTGRGGLPVVIRLTKVGVQRYSFYILRQKYKILF